MISQRPVLSQTEAQSLLAPLVDPVLVGGHVAATERWKTFVTESPELAAPMDATARANMIHCWLMPEVRARIAAFSEVREIESLGFFAIVVGVNPIVRFKFLGRGAPQNVKTDQQKNLALQRYDEETMGALALQGIPAPPTILTCGYKLDGAGLLRSVDVRCDYGSRIQWRWPIFGSEADAGTVVEPVAMPGVAEPRPAVVRSVRKVRKPKGDKEAL